MVSYDKESTLKSLLQELIPDSTSGTEHVKNGEYHTQVNVGHQCNTVVMQSKVVRTESMHFAIDCVLGIHGSEKYTLVVSLDFFMNTRENS